jgi:DNA mismatch repair protein MSH6
MQLPASDEDEDEDDASVKSASARLSRFRKSPVKNDKGAPRRSTYAFLLSFSAAGKARSRSRASEDDDFIVSDHDSGSPSPPPSASRGTSRRGSSASATDDGDASADDEPAPKKSSKAKSGGARPRGRPGARPLASASASAGGGSNSTFLTAAERRAQDTKSDKKSAEDPFAFLQDIKDVRALVALSNERGADVCINCRRMESGPGSLDTTRARYSSLRRRGRTLLLSRSRLTNPARPYMTRRS